MLVIGAEVVAKLSWTEGDTLRLRWSADGKMLRVDEAKSDDANAVRLKKHKGGSVYLTSSALPEFCSGQRIERVKVAHEIGDGDEGAHLVVTLPPGFSVRKAA